MHHLSNFLFKLGQQHVHCLLTVADNKIIQSNFLDFHCDNVESNASLIGMPDHRGTN